jgi:hypothetical protein
MDWEKIIEETKTPEEMKGFAKKLIEKLSKGQKEELLDILLEDKNNTEKLEEESNPFL